MMFHSYVSLPECAWIQPPNYGITYGNMMINWDIVVPTHFHGFGGDISQVGVYSQRKQWVDPAIFHACSNGFWHHDIHQTSPFWAHRAGNSRTRNWYPKHRFWKISSKPDQNGHLHYPPCSNTHLWMMIKMMVHSDSEWYEGFQLVMGLPQGYGWLISWKDHEIPVQIWKILWKWWWEIEWHSYLMWIYLPFVDDYDNDELWSIMIVGMIMMIMIMMIMIMGWQWLWDDND